MTAPVKILHLEESKQDSATVEETLKESDLHFEYLWAADKNDFESALAGFEPDVILSNIALPSINVRQALKTVKNSARRIPFILVADMEAEPLALKLMADGPEDYVLKDRLLRLPVAITHTLNKVTGEHQKERQFNEILNNDKRSRAMIENISDAIILLDKDGNILFSSPSVKRISGYNFLEAIGRTIFDVIHPDEVTQYRKFFNDVCAIPGISMPNIFRIRNKNGGYNSTEGSITNLLHEKSTHALIINCRDITSRKTDEQLLRKSEADLRAIFDNTDISYVFINKENKIVSFNHKAVTIYQATLGLDIKVGDDLNSYIREENKDISKTRIEAVMQGYKISYEAVYTYNTSSTWYAINMLPVRDTSENILGFIISSEDITRRKLVELEKLSMTAEIVQHNKDLDQFTYIVSHNLRSPVASIMGLTGLLRQTKNIKPDDFEKYLDGLALSAGKLNELITDLSFILQTRRNASEKKETLGFKEIIDDLRIIISDLADANTSLETNFDVPEILTVKSYIYSIFTNLITNSIKYRQPGIKAEIFIQTLVKDNTLIIKYKDNGLGFDMSVNGDKMFGLYTRFHNHVEGKGMGLYLVKTQLEMLGGKISVTSEPNKGAEFTLAFPL